MNRLPLALLLSLFLFSGCEKFDWGEKPDFREAYVGTYRVRISGYNIAYSVKTYFDTIWEVDFYYVKNEMLKCYVDSNLRPVIRMKMHNYNYTTSNPGNPYQISESGELKWATDHNLENSSGSFVTPDSVWIEHQQNDGGHYYAYSILKGKKI